MSIIEAGFQAACSKYQYGEPGWTVPLEWSSIHCKEKLFFWRLESRIYPFPCVHDQVFFALEKRLFELGGFPHSSWQVPLDWSLKRCTDELSRYKDVSLSSLTDLIQQQEKLIARQKVDRFFCRLTYDFGGKLSDISDLFTQNQGAHELFGETIVSFEKSGDCRLVDLMIEEEQLRRFLRHDYFEEEKKHQAVLERLEERIHCLAGKAHLEQSNKNLEEQIHHFYTENAVLKERVAQFEKWVGRYEKTIDNLERENKSLKGELSDMNMRIWNTMGTHPGAQEQSEGLFRREDPQSHFKEHVLDNPCRLSDSDSQLSITSSWSWLSVDSGNHCFLSNSLFKKFDTCDFYMSASDLVKGSQVQAWDGTILEVSCHPEQHEVDELVEMRAGDATLTVTPDHRVPILREATKIVVQAKDLKHGDKVLANGVFVGLTDCTPKHLQEKVLVVKLVFKPDKPVPVFAPPPAIATKGQYKKPLRRSGMNKRAEAQEPGDSIPATDECWPDDQRLDLERS